MDIPKLEFKDFVVKTASSKKKVDELLDSIRTLNNKNTVVQIFDNKSIVNRTHLIGAYANALIAFKNHTNKTKNMEMEMLLFAAMTDQIGRAIEIAGAKTNSKFVLFSNKKSALNKLRYIKVISDFNPSTAIERRVAKSIGIKFDSKGKTITTTVLQKMALSRLSSN